MSPNKAGQEIRGGTNSAWRRGKVVKGDVQGDY